MELWAYLGILLALVLVFVGGWLAGQITQELKNVELRMTVLEARLAELENGPKRHTHATTAGLEDALAVTIDVLQEYHLSRAYTEARLKQLNEILGMVRAGPQAYDAEQPSGLLKRPKKK